MIFQLIQWFGGNVASGPFDTVRSTTRIRYIPRYDERIAEYRAVWRRRSGSNVREMDNILGGGQTNAEVSGGLRRIRRDFEFLVPIAPDIQKNRVTWVLGDHCERSLYVWIDKY